MMKYGTAWDLPFEGLQACLGPRRHKRPVIVGKEADEGYHAERLC